MADRTSKALLFSLAWTAFGNRLAALLGITVGLLCLLSHVPVWLASLRGGLAFIGVWCIVRCSDRVVRSLARGGREHLRRPEPGARTRP